MGLEPTISGDSGQSSTNTPQACSSYTPHHATRRPGSGTPPYLVRSSGTVSPQDTCRYCIRRPLPSSPTQIHFCPLNFIQPFQVIQPPHCRDSQDAMARILLLVAALLAALGHCARAQASCHDWPNTCPGTLPRMHQTWQMNKSTIIM